MTDPTYEIRMAEERALLFAVEVIHRRLAELGIAQRELARRMGVSPSRVSQILSGDRRLRIDTYAKTLHALGLRPTWAVEESKEETA